MWIKKEKRVEPNPVDIKIENYMKYPAFKETEDFDLVAIDRYLKELKSEYKPNVAKSNRMIWKCIYPYALHYLAKQEIIKAIARGYEVYKLYPMDLCMKHIMYCSEGFADYRFLDDDEKRVICNELYTVITSEGFVCELGESENYIRVYLNDRKKESK